MKRFFVNPIPCNAFRVWERARGGGAGDARRLRDGAAGDAGRRLGRRKHARARTQHRPHPMPAIRPRHATPSRPLLTNAEIPSLPSLFCCRERVRIIKLACSGTVRHAAPCALPCSLQVGAHSKSLPGSPSPPSSYLPFGSCRVNTERLCAHHVCSLARCMPMVQVRIGRVRTSEPDGLSFPLCDAAVLVVISHRTGDFALRRSTCGPERVRRDQRREHDI